MAFIRKVKTASGATAVQIARKVHGRIDHIDHIGSAHNEQELALLLALAQQRLADGQQSLFDDHSNRQAKIELRHSFSGLLLEALAGQYRQLGFDQLADERFMYLTIARIVRPTSKLDSLRVLADLGINLAGEDQLYRCLKRVTAARYRDQLAKLCFAHASQGNGISLVLYDVTTLYFEIQKEDDADGNNQGYRQPGMSKERRLEPQVIVGLLVDQTGFPLEVHSFEGNKAETKTIVPVVEEFRKRHGLVGVTVVADAGMLSATNLQALAQAGYTYIVGSRMNKIPYAIAELQTTTQPPDAVEKDRRVFTDGQIITAVTAVPGQRIIYQYREQRARLDRRNIDKQVQKAKDIMTGKAATRRAKFLSVQTEGQQTIALNQALIDKARTLAGIKGYVTNLPADGQDAVSEAQIIAYYHQLWRVEQSFRMSKHDLRARPIFHHQKEAIEAHLTVVLAALAVGKTIEQQTGISVKKFVQLLQPIRNGIITLGGEEYPVPPEIPPEIDQLLRRLGVGH